MQLKANIIPRALQHISAPGEQFDLVTQYVLLQQVLHICQRIAERHAQAVGNGKLHQATLIIRPVYLKLTLQRGNKLMYKTQYKHQ